MATRQWNFLVFLFQDTNWRNDPLVIKYGKHGKSRNLDEFGLMFLNVPNKNMAMFNIRVTDYQMVQMYTMFIPELSRAFRANKNTL